MMAASLHKRVHPVTDEYHNIHGSGRWDDRRDQLGWKERMDEWKLQQGNLGPDQYDDLADTDMAM